MRDDAHSGLLVRIRTHPDPRVTRRHTPKRASESGRTPEATIPYSGTEADDVFSPCRPRNL
eukprot:3710044-Pleurochrysis_carterae.AAC.1